jgi:cytochrome P450
MQGSPTYEVLRQAHGQPLRPGAVRNLADFIRERARERLDILVPRGRFDLTQHYAGIVAASTMCNLFRIPLAEAKYVLDMVNAGSITDPETGGILTREPAMRLMDLLQATVRTRRKEGADGGFPLVDGMLDVRLDGRALTDAEIAQVLNAVLVGGTETVPKIVAHGLWELSKRPDQEREVRADLAKNVPVAFKEMVRLCGPAQLFMRTVHRPTVLRGKELKVGQRVAYIVASAARDEREYGEDSEEFRWNRPIERLINFGHGQHFCIGFHLALLEGAILVEEFLRRVPEFTVLEDKVVRRPSNFQWGFNELPITAPIEP